MVPNPRKLARVFLLKNLSLRFIRMGFGKLVFIVEKVGTLSVVSKTQSEADV